MRSSQRVLKSRRNFISKALATAVSFPFVVQEEVFGANDKIVMGCIGMGGRGRGVMGAFMGFGEVRVVAVCDVVGRHRDMAKAMVDRKYGNKDCRKFF